MCIGTSSQPSRPTAGTVRAALFALEIGVPRCRCRRVPQGARLLRGFGVALNFRNQMCRNLHICLFTVRFFAHGRSAMRLTGLAWAVATG